MIEDLKEDEYLNTIQRFDPFKGKESQPFHPTDSYSFGIDTNERVVAGENCHTGCHSYVKSRVFGKGHSLVIVVPTNRVFYEEEEITKYIDLLREIGFEIDFRGILTDQQIKDKHGITNNHTPLRKNYVFLLGENYEKNIPACRYVALCLLRALWSASQFWLPYRFLEFYRYFKKRKIKPSLSKILILANLCPHNLLNDKYLMERLNNRTGYSSNNFDKMKENVNPESGLFAAYYGLVGNTQAKIYLAEDDYTKFYKSFYISLLLTADTKFNLVNFIQNYQDNGKTTASINGLFVYTYGKTRMIWDSENILNNKLRELLKDKQYYKAFLYLKEIADSYKQFPDTHFTNLPSEQIVNGNFTIELQKGEGDKFVKEFVEKTSKEKKKSK